MSMRTCGVAKATTRWSMPVHGLARTPEYVIFNDGTKEGSVVGTNQTDDLEFVDGKRVVVK